MSLPEDFAAELARQLRHIHIKTDTDRADLRRADEGNRRVLDRFGIRVRNCCPHCGLPQ